MDDPYIPPSFDIPPAFRGSRSCNKESHDDWKERHRKWCDDLYKSYKRYCGGGHGNAPPRPRRATA